MSLPDRSLEATTADAFTYDALPGRVIFGAGSVAQLEQEVDRLGCRRVLLIAADAERALAERLAAPLGRRIVATFTDVQPHVPVAVAEKATAVAARHAVDCLLCIGGGSTTGTAKAVALETALPIIAVPTTYAGSECTPVWGTTKDEHKTTGRSMRVLPRVVVYDPELTVGLPAAITASSGINALAHCIESLWAPGRNPITTQVALAGVHSITGALPSVIARPSDVTARAGMMYGGYLAGAAFAVAGSGLHHKICHVLGGAYDLPHAETHSAVLSQVLAFQAPALSAQMPGLRAALGAGAGQAAAQAVYDLAHDVGGATSLADTGLPVEIDEHVVAAIVSSVPPDNPRPVSHADVRELLHAARGGVRPPADGQMQIATLRH
jgi:maleylacetate reductase